MYAAAADRPQFTPPPQPGMLRAFGLAVFAHLLLLFALMHGLQWKREMQNVVAEAELWSAVPREAAPREVVAPSPPPAPVVAPPVVRAPPMPSPQLKLESQIAIEREKKVPDLDKREAAERASDKRDATARRRAELESDKQRKTQRKRDEAQAKQQEQSRAVAETKRKEDDRKRRLEEADTMKRARMREENLERMQGMAGTGSPSSTGMAAQSAGPSASWGGRVQARVRPNIVFTEDFSGNPKAEVEVRTSPDGTIVGKRLVRSSGVKAWDDAVLRALDKTESLPRDTDGRVPSPVVIEFRPRG